jgi:xylose isomerase
MRTYLIFREKAERWNNHEEIQSILKEIEETNQAYEVGEFSRESSTNLLAEEFDRARLASKGLKYERLDQLTMDILLGVD